MKKNLNYYESHRLYSNWQKLFLKMKITIFLFFIGLVSLIASPSYSQNTKISLNMKDARIESVLNEIEEVSEFYFLYNHKLIDVERKVDITVAEKPIKDILSEIFANDVSYIVSDRQIVLTATQGSKELEEIIQQQTVTGKVTDASTGEPMPGVNILVKGTTLGALTDANGRYTVTVPSSTSVLIISFIGYESQEIPIAGRSTVDLALTATITGLDEVVVVGYGTQKRASITGSVVTAKGTDLSKVPATTTSNMLLGRLPGVTSFQRSGEPGADASTILIRGANTLGNNSPLIIVDGIPGRSLDRIDVNTISSITVLKDASAAIYGSQAANGVILITTKRGEIGKPKITINFNEGINQPTRIPEMCNAVEYATLLNEVDYYNNRQPRFTSDDIAKFTDGSDPWSHPDTDWFKEVLRPWARQNYMNANLDGGTERIKYFVSFGTKFQDGYFYNSSANYKQYDFLSNITGTITENISIRVDISGRIENKGSPNNGVTNVIGFVMRGFPTKPAYWPNGLPGPDNDRTHPGITGTDATGYDRNKQYTLNSIFGLDIKIPWVKGLVFNGNASFDKGILFRKRWDIPWYVYFWDGTSYDTNGVPSLVKTKRGVSEPRLQQWAGDNQNILINGIISYENSIGRNSFKIMSGIELRQGMGSDFTAFRRYFVSESIDELFAGGDLEKDNNGSAYISARLNYFGRLNYDYNNKILIEFIGRYDGSYIFPKNSRFGFFPGISVGYRLSNEEFFKDKLAFINNFKLRASWGQTGNDRIPEWQYLSSFAYRGSSNNYFFGETIQSKLLYESRIPNETITWEVANQANIGFEMGILKNKLNFEFDYFNNIRSKILWQRNASVPSSSGITLPRENIGIVSNKGFEFSTTYRNEINKLRYSFSFNVDYSKNKIEFWDEPPGAPIYQQSTGHPMNSELYYEAIGIFKDQASLDEYPHWSGARPGDVIFKDVSKDGVIDGNDRIRYYKSNIPRSNIGMQLNLGYGQFDLSILLQGSFGAIRYVKTYSGEAGNYLKDFYDNRWTEDNPNASQPRAFNREQEYWRNQKNTLFIRETDYMRLKDFQFGYNLSENIVNKIGIQALRFYISGYNLLTISPNLKDFDPESISIEGNSYPVQRIINGGITLTF